jgi:APA family basic amino acid/polyamine antiporter
MSAPTLKRSLSFTLLALYGLGTTIGAGIYVLVGKVAASAGEFAPLSFLIAASLAALTAMSFGELAARYPRSAGEAVYVEQAFGRPALSFAVGLAVALVGLISCAAIISGVVGYLQNIVMLPGWLITVSVIGMLCAIAIWGIAESVTVAAFVTVMEIGGLLVVLWVGREALVGMPAQGAAAQFGWSGVGWAGLTSGAVLAFYAFIGFEDMVNVAEEVKDPARTYPRAIALTLVVTAVLYVGVSQVSVNAMPVAELAESKAPLSDLFARLTGLPTLAIDLLAVLAVVNGALIQIIMASRVLYGLSARGWLPEVFGRVGAATRTPVVATVVAGGVVVVFAFLLPLVTLAKLTSLITLLVFALVNLALLKLCARGATRAGVRRFPIWPPAAGFLCSLAFALFQVTEFLGFHA